MKINLPDIMNLDVRCPGRFLVDSGLLFEINRTVLHPQGFSLAVALEDGVSTQGEFYLTDYRQDPESVTFNGNALERGASKLERFMKESGLEHFKKRTSLYGYHVQGIPRADLHIDCPICTDE